MHRLAVVLACVMFPTQASAQVPPPPPTSPPAAQPARDTRAAQQAGTAMLSGRILSSETGKPLRRSRVAVSSPELREQPVASTDADGQWQIKELPAGRYTINASKGGYVTVSFGQKRPYEPGKPVEVVDGQKIDRLDISLPRGSVVTGRIVDEFGEPVTGLGVTAQRHTWINAQRRMMAVLSAGAFDTTDDLGQYRLHGLSPGDYFISASRGLSSLEKTDDRTDYATTYYPGTPAVGEAQRVTLGEAQEASVSFALARIRVAMLSGTATFSDGRPIADGLVIITTRNAPADWPMRRVSAVKPDGTFTVTNVVPGEYVLQTMLQADVERVATTGSNSDIRNREIAQLPVTVTGSDLRGLSLVAQPTATAHGRIFFDGGAAPGVLPAAVSVLGSAAAADVTQAGASARVRDDWTFDIMGLYGKRLFRVSTPPGWFLKSVVVGDTDVTDTPVEFHPGEDTAGLEITLTRNMAAISGSVQTATGARATDYVVVTFAEDAARWGFQTRFVRAARPDRSGNYRVEGLPAGEYLVAALEYLEPGEESDPEVLERLRAGATSIRLSEAESRTLTVKISLANTRSPSRSPGS